MRTVNYFLVFILSLLFISTGEAKVTVKTINWRNWDNAVEISNATTKLVVVPAIGRIMHYGFIDSENIFWNEPALYGKTLDPEKLQQVRWWNNFGGDKVWPTQQEDFPTLNGFGWPPDPFFDGAPCEFKLLPDGVEITTPVSEYCGARGIRAIHLAKTGSRVTIDQRIEKVKPAANAEAEPITYTIWNITQVRQPQAILFDINPESKFEKGFRPMQKDSENSVSMEDSVGVFRPHAVKDQKIGSDSRNWLVAIIDNTAMAELITYNADASYPDNGCSTEIYTCPRYTELEPLSPLKKLEIGDSMEFTISWDLYAFQKDLTETEKIKAAADWAGSVVK